MERRTELADRIVKYLAKIYPKSATLAEIAKALRMHSCSADPWISSLLANRQIEVLGKKGRSNTYRLKK
jgi:predicted transcriptional regulator with HTH domain